MTVEHLTGAELTTSRPFANKADIAALGFLARYRVEHTRHVYGIALKQWFTFIRAQGIDPLEAQRPHIEIWARLLEEEGRKLSTVAGKLNALGGFYRYALADGLIERDPMLHVNRPTIERVSTTLGLSRPELNDMLKAAEASSLQDHALISLLGYNGLRVSETLGIDVEHLGRHKGQFTATIVRKGSKTQTVPMAPRTAWAVEQLAAGRTGPLFVSREGNRLDRKGASRIVKRIARTVGITKRIHPHSLRHTFVTLARDGGVADRDIIAATGHADGRMIEYYDRNRSNIERSASAIYSVAAFVERAG